MVDNKSFGIGIILFSLVLLIIGSVYIYQTEKFIEGQVVEGPKGECIHEGNICPYEQLNKLAVPKFVGLFLLLVLFGVGLYFYLKKKPEDVKISKARKIARDLGDEETKVYDILMNSNGMVFQNEIVDKTQFSKVKVTRILDKLELKGLIERKRRGMTNLIVLKP